MTERSEETSAAKTNVVSDTETNKCPNRVWLAKDLFCENPQTLGFLYWKEPSSYSNLFHEMMPVSEHLALLNEEKKRGERMREALKGIMARIDDGTICRDISKDHLPTWSLRMIELVQNLADARAALENETKGEA